MLVSWLLLWPCLLVAPSAHAESSRPYWVFFADRGQSELSSALDARRTELHARALSRRMRNMGRAVDRSDLSPNADYVHHVGVISLSRLGGGPDGSLFARRLLKLARHEVGHMYGMAHCTEPSCIMRGANTREEADSIPLHMCPSCAAKLAWRIGDDGGQRNAALAAFYRAHFLRFLEKRLLGPPARVD